MAKPEYIRDIFENTPRSPPPFVACAFCGLVSAIVTVWLVLLLLPL